MRKINEVKFRDTELGAKTKEQIVKALADMYDEAGFSGKPDMSYIERAVGLSKKSYLNRDRIISLAENIINEEYGEILELLNIKVNFDLSYVGEILDVASKLPLRPRDSNADLYEKYNFDFNDEVQKRKLLNIITQGASKNIHRIVHKYKKEIFKIDSSLFFDSDYILKNNEYFEFFTYLNDNQSPNLMKTHAVAYNRVEYIKEQEYKGSIIHAVGTDMVLLLHEAIKGIFEVFTHVSLPRDKQEAIKVLINTDTLEDEMEDLVIGVYVYRKLVDFVVSHKDIDKIDSKQPFLYVYGKLVSEQTDVFNKFMTSLLDEDLDNHRFATIWLDKTMAELVRVFDEYNRDMDDFEASQRTKTSDNVFDPSTIKDSDLYSVKYYKSLSEEELAILMNYLIDNNEYEVASMVEEELNNR